MHKENKCSYAQNFGCKMPHNHILQNGYLTGCLHCKRNEEVKKDSGQLPAIQ